MGPKRCCDEVWMGEEREMSAMADDNKTVVFGENSTLLNTTNKKA
jgi:hypothetical protein